MSADVEARGGEFEQFRLRHHPRPGRFAHPGIRLSDQAGGHVHRCREPELGEDRHDDVVVVVHTVVEREGGQPGWRLSSSSSLDQLRDGDELEPALEQELELCPERGGAHA